MSRIRDDLDPALIVRVANRAEPCLICLKPTAARSTVDEVPVHYLCIARPMWLALARKRGAVEAGGTSWGAQSFPLR